jgi:hypothetical protein
MSHDDAPPYNQIMINAWSTLSALIAAVVFICFCFGPNFLHAGQWVWDLIRWICSPII